METIQLQDIIRELNIAGVSDYSRTDGLIRGVSIDSRTVQPGEMFVAIRGERYDGHRFIPAAAEKGAAVVVADQNADQALLKNAPVVLRVADTLSFLMELAGWYRQRFTVPVIAITGSSGKTTTKEMLAAILSRRYRVVKTEGNRNNFIGVPLTLFRMDATTEAAVVELGTNHPGEIARLTDIVRPTHALITNIGSGHIGFFGSRQAIYREKKALFDRMPESGTIYLNIDDPYLEMYRRPGVRVRRIGCLEEADYRGEFTQPEAADGSGLQINGGEIIRLHIPGRHQAANALLAGAVALDMGLSYEMVKEALEALRPVPQRMEIIRRDGILFINDAYNANPESMVAAIDYLCELPLPADGHRYAVLGDMLELGTFSDTAHREIGKYLAGRPLEHVFCYGDESRLIVESIRQADSRRPSADWYRDHASLAADLKARIRSGDAVLIKGSRGMAMEKVLEALLNGEWHVK